MYIILIINTLFTHDFLISFENSGINYKHGLIELKPIEMPIIDIKSNDMALYCSARQISCAHIKVRKQSSGGLYEKANPFNTMY